MSLEDLNEKLYSREASPEQTRETTPYAPGQTASDETLSGFQKQEEWQDLSAPSRAAVLAGSLREKLFQKKTLILAGLALLVLVGGAAYKVHSMLFGEERVAITVSGPKDVASAEPSTFKLAYANRNWAPLKNASIILTYPDSFHPEADGQTSVSGLRAEIPLGTIGANAQGVANITGKFYGSKGDLVYLKATLRYTPSNLSSAYEASTQFGVNVASSPLSIEISAPLEQATGQDVVYVVDYANRSDLPFANLRVKLDYPEGFRFTGADPKPSEGDGVWYVGTLSGNAGNRITVRGVIVGANDEYKRVHGVIGYLQGDGNFVAYNENERQTKIIASPLSLFQTVNGLTAANVDPGDSLSYGINFRNDGKLGVRDAIVTVALDSPYLDFSKLRFGLGSQGAYDASRKLLSWKASDVPVLASLAPGQAGSVSFSLPVVGNITLSGAEKNIAIRSLATIDSPDLPTPIGANKIIGSNTLSVKLNAVVGIDTLGFYHDAVIPNSGPVPPIVGQETTYTLHLRVNNTSNDLTGARLVATLPTGVAYQGKTWPESESVQFNERANELSWNIGTLTPGGAGREVAFQVGVIPDPSQVHELLTLLNGLVFTARDNFTEQDLRIEKGGKTNALPEDTGFGRNADMRVQPAG